MTSFEIAERFCGPPGMGNGGYVAGRLARLVHSDAAEVTLRSAVPLGRPLSIEEQNGSVRVLDGSLLVAEAHGTEGFAEALPFAPTYEQATEARRRFAGFRDHAFPRCFVCGTERPDGLRIHPGTVSGEAGVAAPWTPDASLASEGSKVAPEFVWAALDCAGAYALMQPDRPPVPMLLGRITARLHGSVAVNERCVVAGWPIEQQGRKRIAGTAVWGEDGGLKAVARATWFDAGPRSS